MRRPRRGQTDQRGKDDGDLGEMHLDGVYEIGPLDGLWNRFLFGCVNVVESKERLRE